MVIDLKVGKFTHADAGQMHLYLILLLTFRLLFRFVEAIKQRIGTVQIKVALAAHTRLVLRYREIGDDISASLPQVAAAIESGSRRFFLRHRFFDRRDTGEQHDPGGSLSSSILTKGRLERQFSGSDLG